jgi:hypothetical protein
MNALKGITALFCKELGILKRKEDDKEKRKASDHMTWREY